MHRSVNNMENSGTAEHSNRILRICSIFHSNNEMLHLISSQFLSTSGEKDHSSDHVDKLVTRLDGIQTGNATIVSLK